ncbi:MAG: hypothetical protein A2087_01560 [Spirochaetes bacterium GWD1_61_31]|nr:MAG: hypothetical protein A2Y37_12460 [Spirochaetes bacterium GWB1_60_80]OHD30181.1 MAG: hypothetical protein A2004_14325 [Spirochaetes bacterium GWC1_61_12]OHD35880.1 MAG: hypothetical protein A2087_01560 [Spirochaetes bacterium GWD1_61_31]OHD42159.1 MAG: hypothetical protein A2Y35_06475 [Spirochaetes bacterium GWE1_60_18]OHD59435.1 MAG: hypothetical protein A2Y32_09915 [Spirochaetes bacterium GWF1_60_12]HAP44052.1 hypothetical protein [Spirochaetaceae bacterium]
MKARLAAYLARRFAKGKLSELMLMALGVAVAVFTSATAANATIASRDEGRRLLETPDYLQIQVAPAMMMRDSDEAIERLDSEETVPLVPLVDLADRLLTEVPALSGSFSAQRVNFTVGEASARGQQFPGAGLPGLGGLAGPGGFEGGGLPPEGFGDPALAEVAEAMLADSSTPAMDAAVTQEPSSLTPPLVERVPGARVDASFFDSFRLRLASGGFFSADDITKRNSVLVAGHALAATLYADGLALGRNIRLDGVTYTIIGVLQPSQANFDGRAIDDLAFVPNTRFSFVAGGRAVSFSAGQLTFMAKDAASVDAALAGIQSFLDREIGAGAMRLSSRRAELTERLGVQDTLFWTAFFLAAVCVLVAALNLMNSAATHAVKRRRTLGMLRAIGATRADTILAALYENAIPAGGGMLAGLALAVILARRSAGLLVPWTTNLVLPLLPGLFAALAAALVPLAVGIIPAVFFSHSAPANLVRPE